MQELIPAPVPASSGRNRTLRLPFPREWLGAILLRKGLIDQAQLRLALAEQRDSRDGDRLGDVLVARGWVKAYEIYDALAEQQGSDFKVRIGDILVHRGLISYRQLREALYVQQRWQIRLGDVVMAKGWVTAFAFYQVLAEHMGLPFVNLLEDPSDPELYAAVDVAEYGRLLIVPWMRLGDAVWVATADPTPEVLAFARDRFGENVRFALASKFDIVWEMQRNCNEYLTARALDLLRTEKPEYSAWSVLTRRQAVFLYGAASVLIVGLVAAPVYTLTVVNVFITLYLLLTFALKFALIWVSSNHDLDDKVTVDELGDMDEAALPVYTILVPMYKEPEVLPILARALRRMDYPLSKLDIKLVLEEDDTETIGAAKALGLASNFEIIRVPNSQPKTKPKALNYALHFARGEIVTIFDAEDLPSPEQLKMVVAAFRKAGPETGCVQARLNYYNADENWLTRMFTLEYSMWFDYYLPALEALRIPIPLGGTSNHFKIDVIRQLNAWDPYNVTEDCDLGIRMTQLGYSVAIVNSTTYEEANNRLGNWIRQRSRWIKGFMQTYLVHMRHPIRSYRLQGPAGFWGMQFFIGGTILTYLFSPIPWAIFLTWLFTGTEIFNPLFPGIIMQLNLFNLLIGNGFFIYTGMLSPFKRGLHRLTPFAISIPLYWLLMSIAGYKAVWQLLRNPFYWEKTQHGISRFVGAAFEHARPKV